MQHTIQSRFTLRLIVKTLIMNWSVSIMGERITFVISFALAFTPRDGRLRDNSHEHKTSIRVCHSSAGNAWGWQYSWSIGRTRMCSSLPWSPSIHPSWDDRDHGTTLERLLQETVMSYCMERELCGSYCLRRDQCPMCKQDYAQGLVRPNYKLPAIPYHYFESDICTISIWPGVMQVRISDEPYTGFGMVITFEHGVSCETRYDDFN